MCSSADFRPMAQDNHILFSQVFETVLKPLPKYDVDIVCRDTPTVKKIRNHHPAERANVFTPATNVRTSCQLLKQKLTFTDRYEFLTFQFDAIKATKIQLGPMKTAPLLNKYY